MTIQELLCQAQTSDYIFEVIGQTYSEVIRKVSSEEQLQEVLLERASQLQIPEMTSEEIVAEFKNRL
jgi:predicted nucleic acid-binding protein